MSMLSAPRTSWNRCNCGGGVCQNCGRRNCRRRGRGFKGPGYRRRCPRVTSAIGADQNATLELGWASAEVAGVAGVREEPASLEAVVGVGGGLWAPGSAPVDAVGEGLVGVGRADLNARLEFRLVVNGELAATVVGR